MTLNLGRTLKQRFGYSDFRPLQEAIIQDALAGRDVFALMPTGFSALATLGPICKECPAPRMLVIDEALPPLGFETIALFRKEKWRSGTNLGFIAMDEQNPGHSCTNSCTPHRTCPSPNMENVENASQTRRTKTPLINQYCRSAPEAIQ